MHPPQVTLATLLGLQFLYGCWLPWTCIVTVSIGEARWASLAGSVEPGSSTIALNSLRGAELPTFGKHYSIMSTIGPEFYAKPGGNSHESPQKHGSTTGDHFAVADAGDVAPLVECWACGGSGELVDEATGKTEPCEACGGTGKTEGFGRVFDGKLIDQLKDGRKHRVERRRKVIDSVADGFGGIMGLFGLPKKVIEGVLVLGGSCCGLVALAVVGGCVVLAVRKRKP